MSVVWPDTTAGQQLPVCSEAQASVSPVLTPSAELVRVPLRKQLSSLGSSSWAQRCWNILNSGMTDSQIRDLWITIMQASYDPGKDRLTYHAWLTAVLNSLEPI